MFEFIKKLGEPDPNYIYANDEKMRVDQKKLARWVGLVALGLPTLLLLMSTDTMSSLFAGSVLATCFYQSISHFYYSLFYGVLLVGSLFFIGSFLIVYKGETFWQSRIANIGGLGAFGVAIFPTRGNGCTDPDLSSRIFLSFEQTVSDTGDIENLKIIGGDMIMDADKHPAFILFANAGSIHYVSAAILFAVIFYFTAVTFPRKRKDHYDDNGNLLPEKAWRNLLYYTSAVIIGICSIALLANVVLGGIEGWDNAHLTFWFEAFALWAFGLSWMVKGRFFNYLFMDKRDTEDQEALKALY